MPPLQVGITAIVPLKMVRGYKRSAIRAVMQKMADDIEKDYKKTVATWNTKVDFKKKVKVTLTTAEAKVWTENEIYRGVDQGTSPHGFGPRVAPALAYQTIFTPKTRPWWIGSRPGGKTGPWTRRMWVDHPGITPRHFTLAIARKNNLTLTRASRNAMIQQIFQHRGAAGIRGLARRIP